MRQKQCCVIFGTLEHDLLVLLNLSIKLWGI